MCDLVILNIDIYQSRARRRVTNKKEVPSGEGTSLINSRDVVRF